MVAHKPSKLLELTLKLAFALNTAAATGGFVMRETLAHNIRDVDRAEVLLLQTMVQKFSPHKMQEVQQELQEIQKNKDAEKAQALLSEIINSTSSDLRDDYAALESLKEKTRTGMDEARKVQGAGTAGAVVTGVPLLAILSPKKEKKERRRAKGDKDPGPAAL